ncbi:MAG: hypothetical protein KDI28_00625 [Pseudomonadales bacterium]|nr:hypothetical protein [Pseudomonadales bacterium]
MLILLRLLAILLIPVLGYMGLRRLAIRYSLNQRQFNLLLLLSAMLGVIVILIVLGRIPPSFILAPIMVAGTFLLRNLHLLIRLLPLWQMFRKKTHTAYGSSGGNDSSSIRTRFLQMELQHSTGDMDGEVLEGAHRGARLSALDLAALMALVDECRVDNDSLQLLEAYLDRVHPQWRGQSEGQGEAQGQGGTVAEEKMDRATALEILGLTDGATEDEIVLAHRRLMQKMHPDRGGSGYLAKKINAARDFLLGRH